MAKVELNPIFERLRGQVGDLVFKRYNDDTIISRKPDLDGREPTEAQRIQRERFRQATAYAKMALADPVARAAYEAVAKVRRIPLYSLPVADFLNPPTVVEVDLEGYTGLPGDEIVVVARDDFGVEEVTVSLAEVGGPAIEDGTAMELVPGSGRWVYAASEMVTSGTPVAVHVTVRDRPGGVTVAEEEKTI